MMRTAEATYTVCIKSVLENAKVIKTGSVGRPPVSIDSILANFAAGNPISKFHRERLVEAGLAEVVKVDLGKRGRKPTTFRLTTRGRALAALGIAKAKREAAKAA